MIIRGQWVSEACFSDDMLYRYALRRRWEIELPKICFVMLNPSTADEIQDDPSVRRCIAYAKRWGFGSLTVANIFAWRSTDPKVLRTVEDPVGPENDAAIMAAVEDSDLTVMAWGNHGLYLQRGERVFKMLENAGRDAYALTLTSAWEPAHPLYLSGSLEPILVLHGSGELPGKTWREQIYGEFREP